ncbi:hypothetical protein FOA52_004100 [Chlamydomonas sp. UWO 241]|nr:hypothetical protein FOA52_004100 [Chlamydomonas sp. UWO 241]
MWKLTISHFSPENIGRTSVPLTHPPQNHRGGSGTTCRPEPLPATTRQSARLAAAEEASASAHAVLLSQDLISRVWPWLDRESKAALRGVSSAMRRLVDGSIEVVASPVSGFSSQGLSNALLLWPRTTHLTLLNVGGADDLAPLATAPLTRVTSLTVRQAPRGDADEACPWDMPAALSSTVAATLRLTDLSGCIDLRSIEFLRCCAAAQLRCLRMPGCMHVSDLAPLGACESLEELWMADDVRVRSLEPLKACRGLRQLDLRACLPALSAQVQDLQLSCTELADPSSVALKGLVHGLQPSIPPDMQLDAAFNLAMMIMTGRCPDGQDVTQDVVAAGAIPALVNLLGHDSTAETKTGAAIILHLVAANHLSAANRTENQAAIAAAGAIPALVLLLGEAAWSNSPAPMRMQEAAARALHNLAANHAGNQAAITAAGAIIALVRLRGPDIPEAVRATVKGVLRLLGFYDV